MAVNYATAIPIVNGRISVFAVDPRIGISDALGLAGSTLP